MRLWDPLTGKIIVEFNGHTDIVRDVAFSLDETKLATASFDGTARVWDIRSGTPIASFAGHTKTVNSVAFSPDGFRIVSSSDDRTARVWEAMTGKEIMTFVGHDGGTHSAEFNPAGDRVVTASQDASARIWDASDRYREIGHDWAVDVTAVNNAGRRLAVSSEGVARVLDIESGSIISEFKGHQNYIRDIKFNPDGSRVATGSQDGTARIWEAASGIELAALHSPSGSITGVSFASDGANLLTVDSGFLRIWDAKIGIEIRNFKIFDGSALSVHFSPDGNWVAARLGVFGGGMWNVHTGMKAPITENHLGEGVILSFSFDNKRILSTGPGIDSTIRISDAETGEALGLLRGHTDRVNSAIFSSDRQLIASSSADNTVRIWDASSNQLIATFTHLEDPEVIGFEPDRSHLLTYDRFRSIRRWDIHWLAGTAQEELRDRVCAGKLSGMDKFTDRDADDPILSGLAGTSPCERRGPLSMKYWLDMTNSLIARQPLHN